MAVEYIYDTNTINYFGDEDYGLITSAVDTTVDHGSIAEEPTQVDDYFYVWIDATVFPFGTVTVSGTAQEESTFDPPITTQLFDVDGVADVRALSGWNGTGSLFEIGGGLERIAAPWIGSSGPLRLTGNATESDVNRYNITSINTLAFVDFGAIASVPQTESDYGSVTAPLTGGQQDYGNIEDATTLTPFGSISLSGTAEESKRYQVLYNGGSIAITGEIVLPLAVSIIGTGSLVTSGSAIEKNTEDYVGNGSSIFTGNAVERNTESYVGSGSLYAASGAAEVFGVNPPESTTLHVFSGSAVEKNTEVYIGSGSLFTVGSAADSSTSNPPEGTVIFSFSGSATEKNTESYNGSGSLFTVGGASIASTNVSTGTGLFSFIGSATEKNTEVYTGSILYRVEGAAFEVFEPSGYQGRGRILVTGTRIKEEYRRFVKARTYVSIV